jgi:hypothetical protein
MKLNKQLRKEVLAILWGRMNTIAYGHYHEMWRLVNSKFYADAWTPKERELMKKKIEEYRQLLEFFSEISKRLRHKP